MRASVLLVVLLVLLAPTVAVSAADLAAFSARYEVYLDGKPRGDSRMMLREESPGRWLLSVDAQGSGSLARLSGYSLHQETRFDLVDGRPRLLSGLTRRENRLGRREVSTIFDWRSGEASWSGQVEVRERGPLPLSADAVNAPLLNLLLALDGRDARPGEVLSYRLLDRGEADRVDYVRGALEPVQVPAGRYLAAPLSGERPSRQRRTTAWYAAELPPLPVRMVQTEPGKPSYELRLAAIETS